jgi:uncharacterized membrane protein HdeD (DUF308 family)
MSTSHEYPAVAEPRQPSAGVRGSLVSMVFLGVALIVLGLIALGSPWIVGLATAVAIGSLLVVSGVVEVVGTLWNRGWNGYLVHLLNGALSIAIGLLFLAEPADAEFTLTLLLACFLALIGTFRIAVALNSRFAAWGWCVVSGLIDLIISALILLRWPASGLWVLGVFAGINLLFRGLNWIVLSLALRVMPASGVRT